LAAPLPSAFRSAQRTVRRQPPGWRVALLRSEEAGMNRVMFGLGFLAALALASAASAAQKEDGEKNGKKVAVATTVNINTASAAELESLPGVGARTAQRIVDYRQKNGAFKKVEELMNVQGIGEKSFLKIKDRLTVGAARAEKTGAPL
jgi:competence protein ComEA